MSDHANPAPETEAELEAFRRRWREEVQARNRRPEDVASDAISKDQRRKDGQPSGTMPGPSTARRREQVDYSEEIAPKAYHDLPDKEEVLKLGVEGQDHDRAAIFREPSSALEHYEKAVEKESHGQLGDSITHYRRAFKLDDGVHEAYKKKHFPPSAFAKSKPTNPNPSNASATVPNPAHHSLQGSTPGLPATIKQLVDDFSTLKIEAAPPATDASPQEPSPLAELPEEILTHILRDLAVSDIAAFARMAQVCKRLAYLILTEESIWKRIALGREFGFGAMHYDYACDVEGFPLEASDEIARYLGSYDDVDEVSFPEEDSDPADRSLAFTSHTQTLLRTTYASSWRQLFKSRPRVRFNGCYISTVNYTRPGATSSNTLSWGAPVHVVTYFRYLRFYRDGSAISLLTTAEPSDVVHHLTKANLPSKNHNMHATALPSSVMKDALRGRWRLSGPTSSTLDSVTGEDEQEGDVFVETEGVVPKYTYKMQLGLAHAGKTARNNKLAWKGFWSHNRLTDDWGEFMLRNDKAFYWSRVKSYASEA